MSSPDNALEIRLAAPDEIVRDGNGDELRVASDDHWLIALNGDDMFASADLKVDWLPLKVPGWNDGQEGVLTDWEGPFAWPEDFSRMMTPPVLEIRDIWFPTHGASVTAQFYRAIAAYGLPLAVPSYLSDTCDWLRANQDPASASRVAHSLTPLAEAEWELAKAQQQEWQLGRLPKRPFCFRFIFVLTLIEWPPMAWSDSIRFGRNVISMDELAPRAFSAAVDRVAGKGASRDIVFDAATGKIEVEITMEEAFDLLNAQARFLHFLDALADDWQPSSPANACAESIRCLLRGFPFSVEVGSAEELEPDTELFKRYEQATSERAAWFEGKALADLLDVEMLCRFAHGQVLVSGLDAAAFVSGIAWEADSLREAVSAVVGTPTGGRGYRTRIWLEPDDLLAECSCGRENCRHIVALCLAVAARERGLDLNDQALRTTLAQASPLHPSPTVRVLQSRPVRVVSAFKFRRFVAADGAGADEGYEA